MGLANEYLITAAAGRSLAAFSQSRGIDLAPLAAAVGLDPASFQQFGVRISLDRFARLLEVLATVSGDESFGLHYGLSFQLGDTGPFGFALQNAPGFRDAVEFLVKYVQLLADYAYFDLNIGKQITRIVWTISPLVVKRDQFVDLGVLLACRHFRNYAGANWSPSRVHLERSAPRSIAEHRALLSPHIKFNDRIVGMEFPSAVLSTNNPAADSRIFELMRKQCEVMLAALQVPKSVLLQAKEKIVALLQTGNATLALVSRQLAMSERSLQRRLSEAGTSYEKLLDETRRELSDRLLADTALPLAEIAHRCGYSSATAYSRAARNWYGKPPAQMRRNHGVAKVNKSNK